jgi:hypothetical protein
MIPLFISGVFVAGFMLLKKLNNLADEWFDEWLEENESQNTIQERQKLFYAAAFWDQFRSGF